MEYVKFHRYMIIVDDRVCHIKAAAIKIGMFNVYCYGQNNKVLHWFRKKKVSAVVLEPGTNNEERKDL